VIEPAANDGDTGSDGDTDAEKVTAADEGLDAADERASAEAAAVETNNRVQGWLYKLPSYKSEALIKHWSDLLKSESDE